MSVTLGNGYIRLAGGGIVVVRLCVSEVVSVCTAVCWRVWCPGEVI